MWIAMRNFNNTLLLGIEKKIVRAMLQWASLNMENNNLDDNKGGVGLVCEGRIVLRSGLQQSSIKEHYIVTGTLWTEV